jgi:hypothetical protein
MPSGRRASRRWKGVLAEVQRELPEIVLAFHEDVESAELNLVIVQPAMERIDIGDAVDAEDLGAALAAQTKRGSISDSRTSSG